MTYLFLAECGIESQAAVRVSSKRGGDSGSITVSIHQDVNDLPLRCRVRLTTEGQHRKHTRRKKLSLKGLPLVAGALALDRQIGALNAAIHVFGHSHINFDQVIEGVRYVHHAFDYPLGAEWSKDPLKQILESVA